MPDARLRELEKWLQTMPQRAIPFHQYMEWALYHPEWGYYANRQKKLGKKGDFFTNAHVGNLLGRMLSRFFLRWRERMGDHGEWTLIEWGAGEGEIALALGDALLEQGVPVDQIHFYLLERSDFHREIQKKRLSDSPIGYRWVEHLSEIPRSPLSFLYSNELVDAFPAHRIKKEGGTLCLSHVTLDGGGHLQEQWLPAADLDQDLRDLGDQLPEGHIAELHLSARGWLQDWVQWMDQGLALTIDYGGGTQELLSRPFGTLRGYKRHRLLDPFKEPPGEMDLTVHVHFDYLRRWGEEAGLQTVFNGTQSEFLIKEGILEEMPPSVPSDPFSPEAKRIRAIQQLTHPQAMGEAFRVLVQAKGIPLSRWDEE